MDFENVIVEKDGAVAVVTLNRPQALNALSYGLVKDLSLAMQELDRDPEVRVIVVTGGQKVFAAGADIKEMAERGEAPRYSRDSLLIYTRRSAFI